MEQRTPLQPGNGALDAHSNYGYVSDTVTTPPGDERSATTASPHPPDFQPQDYTDHQGAVYYAADSNSIPIRYPPNNPLTNHDSFSAARGGRHSRDYADYASHADYARPNGYLHPQSNGDVRGSHQLWHNPSFVSDVSEDTTRYRGELGPAAHNTDNYQQTLWNNMRASPQVSIYTDNTYDEIGNQKGYNHQRKPESFRSEQLSEV